MSGVQVQINNVLIKDTALNHKIFCPQNPKDFNATFHGLPAFHQVYGPPSLQAGYVWGFTTGNALFSIFVSFKFQSDALNAPTSTPLPATLFATEQAAANEILASLQPSDTKPLVC